MKKIFMVNGTKCIIVPTTTSTNPAKSEFGN
jgi:hypothetical protein